VDDFATWSGLPVTLARRAWKTLAQTGSITEYGALSVPTERMEELRDSPGTLDVRMLPAYDNYLVGYRGRELSVPAAHHGRVWPGGGASVPRLSQMAWPSERGPAVIPAVLSRLTRSSPCRRRSRPWLIRKPSLSPAFCGLPPERAGASR
jgi:hypothetical protein